MIKVVELADFYLGGTANINSDHFAEITTMFTDAFVTYAVECFVSRAQEKSFSISAFKLYCPVLQYMFQHKRVFCNF